MKWTLLFDIDGTLISTKGAGFAAIGRAMEEMFGVASIPAVRLHGRTDYAIISDIFADAGIAVAGHMEAFSQLYWKYLPDALRANEQGEILPGVSELLEALHTDERFCVGLLTGNAKVPAMIKMQHFDLDRYFSFGGFGDTTACRNEVAKLAAESAQKQLGEQFDLSRIWVIGDTISDIHCARAINSKIVAVETGGGTPSQLAGEGPDIQLPTMSDYRSLIEIFVK
ncbi:MAG: haloacid dehalogenase-like hydrolase [Planctomycetota bacterium]